MNPSVYTLEKHKFDLFVEEKQTHQIHTSILYIRSRSNKSK